MVFFTTRAKNDALRHSELNFKNQVLKKQSEDRKSIFKPYDKLYFLNTATKLEIIKNFNVIIWLTEHYNLDKENREDRLTQGYCVMH